MQLVSKNILQRISKKYKHSEQGGKSQYQTFQIIRWGWWYWKSDVIYEYNKNVTLQTNIISMSSREEIKTPRQRQITSKY